MLSVATSARNVASVLWRRRNQVFRRCFADARPSIADALKIAAPGNLVRFRCPSGTVQWGRLGTDEGTPCAQALDSDVLSGTSASGDFLEISELLSPLPVDPPPAVICLGLNYHAHAVETDRAVPRFPVLFYKSPTSVSAPEASVRIPDCARAKPEVDYEAELALVIGKEIRDASPNDVADALLGVTAGNDLSARRWQGKKGGGQWSRAKSFDGFCPVGPSLTPFGEVALQLAPGGKGLRLRASVNEHVMQDSFTNDMIFPVEQIVSYLSEGTTLLPGTLILTGTPAGVGFVRKPPTYLMPGDNVAIELEGVGRLLSHIV